MNKQIEKQIVNLNKQHTINDIHLALIKLEERHNVNYESVSKILKTMKEKLKLELIELENYNDVMSQRD